MDDAIQIQVYDFPVRQFVRELETINASTGGFSQVLRKPESEHGFTITPEAATILVTGVSSLGVLINSILVFLANRKSGQVRIISASGKTLEFPRDTPPEKVQYYLEVAGKLEVKHILVSAGE